MCVNKLYMLATNIINTANDSVHWSLCRNCYMWNEGGKARSVGRRGLNCNRKVGELDYLGWWKWNEEHHDGGSCLTLQM